MKQKIIRAIKIIKFLFVRWGIHWNDPRVCRDIARWKEILKISEPDKAAVAVLVWDYPEFRNLLIYRHPKGFWKYWFKLWYKPMESLLILAGDIGGGLFIQHGFATGIGAESIGENCWINQQVTIGFRDNTRGPIIGNNVTITCGAKVLGPITIEDNVTIGANAVVIKDLPANSVWGGVPAKRIR